jgi:outer membrane protein OmpA-like peptidoglycan-associated protein
MKKGILTVIAISLVSAPAFAADKAGNKKPEAVGVGGGLAVGAVLGGPIGAIVGAALGGWVGDKFSREQTARTEVEFRYELAQADVDALQSELSGSERRIAQMQAQIATEERAYRRALQQALNAEVFFRTGESSLHEDSVRRLGEIARVVGSMDGFIIRLAGHADNRGDAEYNEQLSAERAVAVRDAMIAAGFPNNRISITAEGENLSQAAEGDLDAMALERRVQIELVSADDRLVAQQP